MDFPPRVHHAPETTLALLRSVESTPKGDLEWALHCTTQQAVLLRLQVPGNKVDRIGQLAEVFEDVLFMTDPELEEPSFSMLDQHAKAIVVSDRLSKDEQLRAALREIKTLIDLPARLQSGFTEDEYSYLADAFATLVMGTAEQAS